MTDQTPNVQATWYVQLMCECPSCKDEVNLLDDADFWDGRYFRAAEHHTERTRDVEVYCPECGHEFKVDLTY